MNGHSGVWDTEGLRKRGKKRMEKICIVKLRKRLTNPVDAHTYDLQGQPGGPVDSGNRLPLSDYGNRCSLDVYSGSVESPIRQDGADGSVSLPLTLDQARVLQSHPCLASLEGAASTQSGAAIRGGYEAVVIKLELPALPPLRLLKPDEVTQMLRISRSSLRRMINEGKLKSYKFGRLQRIMLYDVLSYLEAHQQRPPFQRQPAQPKTSRKGMAQTVTIKEG
jgi:excisionase family DNA binding protein